MHGNRTADKYVRWNRWLETRDEPESRRRAVESTPREISRRTSLPIGKRRKKWIQRHALKKFEILLFLPREFVVFNVRFSALDKKGQRYEVSGAVAAATQQS